MQRIFPLAALGEAQLFCYAHLRNKQGFHLLIAKHPTKNIYEVKSKLVLAYAVCYQYIW